MRRSPSAQPHVLSLKISRKYIDVRELRKERHARPRIFIFHFYGFFFFFLQINTDRKNKLHTCWPGLSRETTSRSPPADACEGVKVSLHSGTLQPTSTARSQFATISVRYKAGKVTVTQLLSEYCMYNNIFLDFIVHSWQL